MVKKGCWINEPAGTCPPATKLLAFLGDEHTFMRTAHHRPRRGPTGRRLTGAVPESNKQPTPAISATRPKERPTAALRAPSGPAGNEVAQPPQVAGSRGRTRSGSSGAVSRARGQPASRRCRKKGRAPDALSQRRRAGRRPGRALPGVGAVPVAGRPAGQGKRIGGKNRRIMSARRASGA